MMKPLPSRGSKPMKRFHFIFIAVSAILMHAPAAFAAVDLSIGGTAWYIWWKPAWSDARATSVALVPRPVLFTENATDFKPSSNVMGGPILSIGFLQRWSIQSVFTIGRFTYRSTGWSRDTQLQSTNYGVAPSYKKYTRDVLKWDSDTSISCALHRVVKLYAGFKYQGYRYEESMQDILWVNLPPAVFGRKLTDEVQGYGGGLGLGLTIPVVENFYIMLSGSGVVLWSVEKIKINKGKTFLIQTDHDTGVTNFTPLPLYIQTGRYFSYGCTASLGLTYYIEKISTTLSLGGRYQLLFNRQRYSKHNPYYNDVATNIIDRQYDHFYGITMSVLYTFHIGKKN